MRITKEQGIKIKKAIRDRGYSITGFCRIHNISDRQFYAWLAGTNGYERNGIGKHFQEITDALLTDATDATDATDYKRTDQWGSDWLEHDIRNARGKCKACHAATRCADCCFLCENRCDQYRTCDVVKQYAVDAAPYDPSEEQLIDAFKDLQQDRSMLSRIKNLNDYTYKPVVKDPFTTDQLLNRE